MQTNEITKMITEAVAPLKREIARQEGLIEALNLLTLSLIFNHPAPVELKKHWDHNSSTVLEVGRRERAAGLEDERSKFRRIAFHERIAEITGLLNLAAEDSA